VTKIALEALLPVSVVEPACRIQSESGGRLDLIAAKLGLISNAELASLYATHLGEPLSRLGRDGRPPAPELF